VKSRATVAGELGLDRAAERRQLEVERAAAAPSPADTAAAATMEVVDDAGHKHSADGSDDLPTTREDTNVGRGRVVTGTDALGRPYKTVDGVHVPVSPAEAKAIKAEAAKEKPDGTNPMTGTDPSAAEASRDTLKARLSAWLDSHDGPPTREARLDVFDDLIDAEALESLGNHDGGAAGKAWRDLLMETVGAVLFGARLTGGSNSPSDIDVGHVYEGLAGEPELDTDIKRYL
jgi:hypothetical protein